jgi:hypothetical protein
MPLYQLTSSSLVRLSNTSFQDENLRERQDLQRLLKRNITVISPDTLVIAEEFGDFSDSNRRIDLLAVDKDANLVVIELKRTSDGGHMELLAIRYASMVANMTWDHAVYAYRRYLEANGTELDAESSLLEFLGWDSPQEDNFGQNVRIILAAGDFSKEITTSVLWLNERELDITCVRLGLYRSGEQLLLNAEQIIPLPEAEGYQVEVRQKRREERGSRASTKDRSVLTLYIDGESFKSRFKKSDIGLNTVLAIKHAGLLDSGVFELLRNDTSCSFQLLKKADEVTDTERKYSKYRVSGEPEIEHEGVGYYVARNWGIGNISGFINRMIERFPTLSYEIE